MQFSVPCSHKMQFMRQWQAEPILSSGTGMTDLLMCRLNLPPVSVAKLNSTVPCGMQLNLQHGCKTGLKNSDKIKALVEVLTSDNTATYINDTFNGTIVPYFVISKNQSFIFLLRLIDPS